MKSAHLVLVKEWGWWWAGESAGMSYNDPKERWGLTLPVMGVLFVCEQFPAITKRV